MARIGLCLGAGGLVGQAYQAGVLAALEVDLGWDARQPEVLVGTSAGAVTGAMLRLDTAPLELASWVLGQPWSPGQPVLDGLAAVRLDLPPLRLRSLVRPWRLPAVHSWVPAQGRPWAARPLAVISSMVPPGRTAMEELLVRHRVDGIEGDWPIGLWICALRRGDGSRVVFGQDPDRSVRLTTAVAASACIPGYFAPVTINGEQFLDGGLYSPTNADVLVSEHLDVVVIVSPMSGGSGAVDRVFRGFARRRLRAEIKRLEADGTEVVLFEPGPASSRAMGLNPMATDGIDCVLRAAFFEAGSVAAQPETRRLLLPGAPAR